MSESSHQGCLDACGSRRLTRDASVVVLSLPLDQLPPLPCVSASQSVELGPGDGFHQQRTRAKKAHFVGKGGEWGNHTCLIHGRSDFTAIRKDPLSILEPNPRPLRRISLFLQGHVHPPGLYFRISGRHLSALLTTPIAAYIHRP